MIEVSVLWNDSFKGKHFQTNRLCLSYNLDFKGLLFVFRARNIVGDVVMSVQNKNSNHAQSVLTLIRFQMIDYILILYIKKINFNEQG